jgi:putative flippase GtrA
MELNRNDFATVMEDGLVVETVDHVNVGPAFTPSIVPWLKHEFVSSAFVKFIIAGGFAAVINFSSRIGLSVFLGYETAIVIAYLIGMLTAFALNRRFVFESRQGRTAHQFFYFTLVNLFAIFQTLVVSLLLARMVLPWLGIEHGVEEIAHFFGICVPVFTSFLGHKYLSFKKP